MRNLVRKMLAVVLAVATAVGTGVAASAATTASKNYDVTVNNKKLTLSKGTTKYKPYVMKTADITLQVDEAGDLLVCYTNTDGKYKGVSLGKQTSLNIGGTINALKVLSSVSNKVAVSLTKGSDVTSMTVSNKGSVNIAGDVGTLLINGAANVKVTDEAIVTTAKVTSSSAKLNAASGTSVKKVSTVNKSNVTGSGIGSKSSAATTKSTSSKDEDDDEDEDDSDKLEVELDWDNSDFEYSYSQGDGIVELRDIEDDLENYVTVTGRDKNDRKVEDLKGRLRWGTSSYEIFNDEDYDEDDGKKTRTYNCGFTFTPSDKSYETKSGTIKITVTYEP